MRQEEYLLVCLMEEAAEVQQAAAKCLRFSPEDIRPGGSKEGSNVNELNKELNDLLSVVLMLQGVTKGLVAMPLPSTETIRKKQLWSHHSVTMGALDGPLS